MRVKTGTGLVEQKVFIEPAVLQALRERAVKESAARGRWVSWAQLVREELGRMVTQGGER